MIGLSKSPLRLRRSHDARAFPGKADGLTQALLEHGIVVRPFGDVLRISVGVQAENDAVIAAMANVLGAPATN